ncbi:hypothetical protein STRMOE7_36725 [Streptomyces sp. MOE7]|nr:hypothetical protein STRMOE7_36725 [Streptomyces sp. MOE7]
MRAGAHRHGQLLGPAALQACLWRVQDRQVRVARARAVVGHGAGPQGIRVNSVAPGPMWTDKVKDFIGSLAASRGMSLQEGYDEVAADMDLRRLQSPEETADAVLFLASDPARAVTGHCLVVNCGEYHH